jgi:hypothetical protein
LAVARGAARTDVGAANSLKATNKALPKEFQEDIGKHRLTGLAARPTQIPEKDLGSRCGNLLYVEIHFSAPLTFSSEEAEVPPHKEAAQV